MTRLVLVAFLVGCAGGASDGSETEVGADATSDPTAELTVRTSDTTLTVTRDLIRRGDLFVLRGKTSRTLTGGFGFVTDDPYGDFAQQSARVFELTWPVSTARTLADGVDQFVGLDFVHASGKPDALTGHVIVRPRLASFTGSSKIYLTAELTPVVVAGDTVYRIAGHSVGANTELHASIDHVELAPASVRRLDDSKFEIDLTPAQAFALTATGDLQINVAFSTGGVEKHAHLGLSVKKLGMTAGDAEEVWPRPTCTSSVKACLLALPGIASDLGACGEATKVNACRGTVGVSVTDVDFQAALHTADVRLAAAAAHADAIGLAGADRADAFLQGAHQTIESHLEQQLGRWFITPAGRDASLAAALESGLDTVYARPLDVLVPHVAVHGNAAAMRQVAADAVLAELARMDFAHSEFARTLEDLTHEFRAQHVASIRAFRETIVPEVYPGIASRDVYIGDWLGLHTEVVIERATGAVVSTLVEID